MAVVMTEARWLKTASPEKLLDYLLPRGSARKLRLFAAACCRRIWHLMIDQRSRWAVETADLFADGHATALDLCRALEEARSALDAGRHLAEVPWPVAETEDWSPATEAAEAAWGVAWANARDAARGASRPAAQAARKSTGESAWSQERRQQCHLLRDLFANPFRAVTLCGHEAHTPRSHPSATDCEHCRRLLGWNQGVIGVMAQTIYDERRFEDLPILADALEEAGCASAEILAHCRAGTDHARGCWPLDLLLGKQ